MILNKELITKIKAANVDDKHKKLYTFCAWLLEKQEEITYDQFMIRANGYFKSNEGYFNDLYHNLPKRERKERIEKGKKRMQRPEVKEKHRIISSKKARVWQLLVGKRNRFR